MIGMAEHQNQAVSLLPTFSKLHKGNYIDQCQPQQAQDCPDFIQSL